MTGLLGAMTSEEISSMPREGWANVNDPPEVREWLDTIPDEEFYELERLRQQAEQSGKMDLFYQFLQTAMP
tara:strand:- start:318 stop:530 length:213 start_codon:yes stop_codon:yes gene_type:complete